MWTDRKKCICPRRSQNVLKKQRFCKFGTDWTDKCLSLSVGVNEILINIENRWLIVETGEKSVLSVQRR